MRRDKLVKSTPFRLALIFALMFVGAFLATGVIVYELVSLELQRHQDETIQETYAVIASAYGDSDLTDLLDTVRTNIHATRGHARIFLVTGPDGKALAGNVPAQGFPDGWSDAVAGRIGLSGDTRYRIYAGEVDGKRLVVGLSYQEVDSLNEIMLGSFAWASLVVVVLAVAGGVLIATRAQARFDAVRDTMDRVSLGDLSARIPLSDRNDDIDLLARDINAALTRLAATVEGMKQVSADIAHDLKTPLNRLKITIEDALDRHEDGEAVVGDLELAAQEADRINQTFEALLRIAQIESGARKARFAAVDLDEILSALADVYADVAEDAGQKLVATFEKGEPAVIPGDRELLTQMYVNLIENAIRHCPPGTTIRLNVERRTDQIVTVVEDDGPGIPEAEREQVFRRLYRLEKSRSSPGTGLGLSLVKAVADLHEASIHLEDAQPGLRVAMTFAAASRDAET